MNNNGNTPAVVDGKVSLDNAPGADISFDDLFAVETNNIGGPQAPVASNPPAVPQAPEYVLKSEDGKIVYKTAEDAINGIRHKDDLVERYRAYLQEQGVDPNTLQKLPAPQVQAAQPGFKYIGNEDKLFDALSTAVASRDKKAYATALREYNEEVTNQNFAPIAPLLADVARQRAVREVSQEAPEFVEFQRSAAWKQTLDSLPKLKQAIEYSETDLNAASGLSELYRIALLVSKGMKPAAPVQAAPIAPPQPAPVARPTMSSSMLAPPQPSAPASFGSKAGRDQMIADLLAKGVADVKI
jgi:hypothetical protein